MSVLINMIARNPPSLLIVIGFLFIVLGSANSDPNLTEMGMWCIGGGFVLQVLWLFMKGGRL